MGSRIFDLYDSQSSEKFYIYFVSVKQVVTEGCGVGAKDRKELAGALGIECVMIISTLEFLSQSHIYC